MKMKKEDYNYIEKTINEWLYNNPSFTKDYYIDNNLSNTRYRWDIFHFSGLTKYTCDVLYKYLNDDHINTALKKIIK